jgi:hypothetical protein
MCAYFVCAICYDNIDAVVLMLLTIMKDDHDPEVVAKACEALQGMHVATAHYMHKLLYRNLRYWL